MVRLTHETVREPVGRKTKHEVVRLERIALALEAEGWRENNPLRRFGLMHAANRHRLKALLMRQYKGGEIVAAADASMVFAKSERVATYFD